MQKPTQQYNLPEDLIQDISAKTLVVEEKVLNKQVPEYPDFVAALAKPMATPMDNILHMAVGLAGEAGELLDAVKKGWAYNKPLDFANMIEELGDALFYIQGMLNFLGLEPDTVIRMNQHKLLKRFPNVAYSDLHAQQRLDKQ